MKREHPRPPWLEGDHYFGNYLVRHSGTGRWTVFAIGPKGGKRWINTYTTRDHADSLAIKLQVLGIMEA